MRGPKGPSPGLLTLHRTRVTEESAGKQMQLQHPARDSAFLAAPRNGDRWFRRHILGGEILEVVFVREIGGVVPKSRSQSGPGLGLPPAGPGVVLEEWREFKARMSFNCFWLWLLRLGSQDQVAHLPLPLQYTLDARTWGVGARAGEVVQ